MGAEPTDPDSVVSYRMAYVKVGSMWSLGALGSYFLLETLVLLEGGLVVED